MQEQNSNDFSFFQLLRDMRDTAITLDSWKHFEDFIGYLCKRQDPDLICQENKYPDIILSCGQGVEAKLLTDRATKSVNLNSTCPGKTYYVFAYYADGCIQHAAIVHGHNYYSPDMEDIQERQTGTQHAENRMLKFRTRLMWEVESPFRMYGEGFFLVDVAGGIIRI